jgi:hypothetical protein
MYGLLLLYIGMIMRVTAGVSWLLGRARRLLWLALPLRLRLCVESSACCGGQRAGELPVPSAGARREVALAEGCAGGSGQLEGGARAAQAGGEGMARCGSCGAQTHV